MGTKVQSKTYFPGSMRDLNSGFCNGSWDVFHENGLSGPGSMQYFDAFLMRQAADGYAKDQMRQMMLKQESIFRHQLQELHRVYKRQRDLMNELATKQGETSNSSRFRGFGVSQRSVIDLEQLAYEDEDNDEERGVGDVRDPIAERTFNLADLNEPIPTEETSFAVNDNRRLLEKLRRRDSSANSSFLSDFPRQSIVEGAGDYNNLNGVFSYRSNPSQSVPKRAVECAERHRSRTLFGVELCEPPPPSFGGCVVGKGGGTEVRTAHDRRLPPWLVTKPNETERGVYQMNLHSLQNHSQQFFKKSEVDNCQGVTKILGVPIADLPRKGDDEVKDVREAEKNGESNCVSDFRRHIDLNLSCDEEEAPPPSPPESAVGQISETVIDLEALPVLEPAATAKPPPKDALLDLDKVATAKPPPKDALLDLDKVAAEAIVSISSSKPVNTRLQHEEPSSLQWFADVITSGDDVSKFTAKDGGKSAIPEGMDYFEFMTLRLQDTKEEHCNYKPTIPAAEEAGPPPKRAARKGVGRRGRQRRDFQRDVLPGIVSLSRREVSEDLLTFEETFNAMGVLWQPKRKASAAARNSRGRRQVVVSIPSPQPPPPPPPPPPVEENVCREVAVVEKSLGGWGKRTRRLPRQRCSNGGGHYRSLALKC